MPFNPAFFEKPETTPARELSQGDIVADIPYGLVDRPLRIARTGPPWIGEPHEAERPQAFSSERAEHVLAPAKLDLAMVLWHGCQIDKFLNKGQPTDKAYAAVAPVLRLSRIGQESTREAVRAGRHRAFFPLPAFDPDGNGPSEFYVDLRLIWSVKQALLLERRRGALTPDATYALYGHLFFFLTGLDVANSYIACPTCATSIKLSEHRYEWTQQDKADPTE